MIVRHLLTQTSLAGPMIKVHWARIDSTDRGYKPSWSCLSPAHDDDINWTECKFGAVSQMKELMLQYVIIIWYETEFCL